MSPDACDQLVQAKCAAGLQQQRPGAGIGRCAGHTVELPQLNQQRFGPITAVENGEDAQAVAAGGGGAQRLDLAVGGHLGGDPS